MSKISDVTDVPPDEKEHTRVCVRCNTEYPLREICPMCYGLNKPVKGIVNDPGVTRVSDRRD